MPRLTCWCNEQISLSPIPNDNGFEVFSERMVDGLIERIIDLYKQEPTLAQFEKWIYAVVHRTPPRPLQVYECPACGRLAVFRRPSDQQAAMWYMPEPIAEKESIRLRELVSTGDESS
jgi:hypothetical protein